MDETKKGVSRRQFIETAAMTGAAITIVPRHVLGRGFTPPSDLLNIACVGIGGKGPSNKRAVGSPNHGALLCRHWGFPGPLGANYQTGPGGRRHPPTAP